MAVNGGSIKSLAINGRPFGVAGDSDASLKLQKFENELQPNGNGTNRRIATAVVPALEGVQLSIDDAFNDLQFLQETNDDTKDADFTIQLASGVTYSGHGTISGDFSMSTQSATAEIGIMFRVTPTRQ